MPDLIKHLANPLVLISDTHISRAGDGRARLLLDLLQKVAVARPQYLVLLGDIFDFYFGAQPFFAAKYESFGRALQQVAAAGTKVIFFEGNHEFSLSLSLWEGIEFVPTGDKIISLQSKDGAAGPKVKLAHGDLIYNDWKYRWFRGLVKSKVVERVAVRVPPTFLDGYALGHAKVSRAQDRYRRLDHDSLLAAGWRWLLHSGETADYGIFGHFHVPYASHSTDGRHQLLSVDSWDVPNALFFDQDQNAFMRVFWNDFNVDNFKLTEAKVKY